MESYWLVVALTESHLNFTPDIDHSLSPLHRIRSVVFYVRVVHVWNLGHKNDMKWGWG